MRASRLSMVGIAGLMVAAGVTVSPASAQVPSVIGGSSAPALGAAAVYYETDDLACSGSLWKATIVVTTADCIVPDDGTSPAQPQDIALWPPGANNNGPSSPVSVTQIIYDPGYNDSSTDGDDIAFLILNAPLGTPIITRLATQEEASALSAAPGTQFQFASYGQTTPGNPDIVPMSDVPIGMTTTPAIPAYGGGIGVVNLSINGVTGPCYGDEGGPWMVQAGSDLLLVAIDVEGYGGPCDVTEPGHGEVAAVVSGAQSLVDAALAAAGLPSAPRPTTCVTIASGAPSCDPGLAYLFTYCVTGPSALIQAAAQTGWQTVASVTATRSPGCGSSSPYLLNYYGLNQPGTQAYRASIPVQAGVRTAQAVPFSVTTTS